METSEDSKNKFLKTLFVFTIILSVYFAVRIFSEIKKDSLLGESSTPATISFSGHGEVTAVPDIANIYFAITQDDKTVKAAQADVAVVEKKALDFLKTKGVADADIQTANASFNPKYEYKQAICPPVPLPMSAGTTGAVPSSLSPYYCPSGKQIIIGYTASESITVKIRNTDSVGDIMQGLGTTGVSDLSGPDFTIDNPDAVQEQAREKAIDDAKTKAQTLAKDLGISLGKITSFSEFGNSPIMYANGNVMSAEAVPSAAPAVIPKGENTVSSDVTITYEIR